MSQIEEIVAKLAPMDVEALLIAARGEEIDNDEWAVLNWIDGLVDANVTGYSLTPLAHEVARFLQKMKGE